MADKDDDDLLNDLDFDKIAEDKKEGTTSADSSDDAFEESLEDLADLDDDLLSSDDLMGDLDDIDALDDALEEDDDDEDWDLDDEDDDFSAGPAQLSAPKKKSFIARNFSLIIILLALGGGGGYYYTQYYVPSQSLTPPATTPSPVVTDQTTEIPQQPTTEITDTLAPVTPEPAKNNIPDLASQTELPPMPTPVVSTNEIIDSMDPVSGETQMNTEEAIDLDFDAESLTPMPDMADLEIEAPAEPSTTTEEQADELSPFDPLEIETTTAVTENPAVIDEVSVEPIPEPPSIDIAQDIPDLQSQQPEVSPETPDKETIQLEQLNNELSNKNQELTQKLQNADSTINDLNQTIDALKAQISSLSSKTAATTAIIKPKTTAKKPAAATKKPDKSKTLPSGKWKLRAALPGKATIARENSNDLHTIEVGDTLNPIGKIQSITLVNGAWIVQGTKGKITR